MVSKVASTDQELGLQNMPAVAKTEVMTVQTGKEESGSSSICKIEETRDCSSRSASSEAEVENSESGIWMEVKNARVHFSWEDFFYALTLGLGPTVCTLF